MSRLYSLQKTQGNQKLSAFAQGKVTDVLKNPGSPESIIGHGLTREQLFGLSTDVTLRFLLGSTIFPQSPGTTFPQLHKEERSPGNAPAGYRWRSAASWNPTVLSEPFPGSRSRRPMQVLPLPSPWRPSCAVRALNTNSRRCFSGFETSTL